MFHFCQHNQVTSSYICIAPTVGDEIDALSGVARKDDLFASVSVDEVSCLNTSFFHPGCCFFADLVDSAMNIGMIHFVIGSHGLDHGTRFL